MADVESSSTLPTLNLQKKKKKKKKLTLQDKLDHVLGRAISRG